MFRLTIAAIAGAAATLSACGGGSTPPPSAPPDQAVEMTDRVGVPMTLTQQNDGHFVTGGSLATLTIDNRGLTSRTITHVQSISDEGLIVTYMGHTRCHGGCIGTGSWDDPATQAMFRGSLDGTYPFVLPPRNDPEAGANRVVLRLEVSPRAMNTLRSGCLYLRSLLVTWSDGTQTLVQGWGHRTILGVFADDHALPGSVPYGPDRCPLDP
jgi:hypothetical protein